MAPLFALEKYSGQTTDELLALEGKVRADSLAWVFEQGLYQKADGPLSREETYVLAIEALEREVNNGGYDQLFINSSSELVPLMVEALQAAACGVAADITREAIACLNLPPGADGAAVEAAGHETTAGQQRLLSDCTDRYRKEVGDLAPKLLAFIRVNRSMIRLP